MYSVGCMPADVASLDIYNFLLAINQTICVQMIIV